MHLPAQHIGHGGCAALVGNVLQLGARHHVEQLGRQMRATAIAGRGVAQRLRSRFGERDQLPHVVGRHRRMGHQKHGEQGRKADRHKVLFDVVGQLVHQGLIDGVVDGAHEQAVAIGGLACRRRCAHHATRTWAVVDDGGHVPQLAQLVCTGARRGVHRASRGERHDELHGLGRPGIAGQCGERLRRPAQHSSGQQVAAAQSVCGRKIGLDAHVASP
ncbi:hypothetical protein SDC9_167039 [bioreactor metagenome]|uniref:Uncharacterized protein n=1 Tax=bioreactor metagenome TaxID=1076179 RepID=A0A645FYQ7_9ZZZZ